MDDSMTADDMPDLLLVKILPVRIFAGIGWETHCCFSMVRGFYILAAGSPVTLAEVER